MRPSNKQRSRNKPGNHNQRRSVGNIINRVFESAGPDGKVRGTPQQVIEKYQALARDAQLSGDRVAAESFLQHSEHYSRMLGEAQQQMVEQRENQERNENQQQSRSDGQQQGEQQPAQQNQAQNQPRQDGGSSDQRQPRRERERDRERDDAGDREVASSGMATIDPTEGGEAAVGLIETPENRPASRRRERTRQPASEVAQSAGESESRSDPAPVAASAEVNGAGHAAAADEAPKAPARRAPRPRRTTRAATATSDDAPAAPATVPVVE